ncbi:hypothetical protein OG204_34560 [Streptomyces sp. NBC_01387]|uniref:hypothetical protein n=1 Tax=unclassified Streptomyces TaxID=2593676 RepID=UPI002024BC93|nr:MULTISPECIES: hypothetical protein [unclassified Streptomyces]WSC18247.1 hypothetical protein OIE60_00540 [Streptomyces sp. NBC_01766]WSV52288.1 hypothetical protein OG282_00570 [Streptomyces sp. NBC_01014]
MNHRYVSTAVVLGSAAALLATMCGSSSASPRPATSAPAVTSGKAGGSWQPCHLPAGYKHFFKLDSAKNVKGNTVVRVTPETCRVNTKNDEDVIYTPSGAAQSLVFASGASVKVLSDTTTRKVTPKWLVNHKLANTPYFYYRVNGQSQISAMEEIYHP